MVIKLIVIDFENRKTQQLVQAYLLHNLKGKFRLSPKQFWAEKHWALFSQSVQDIFWIETCRQADRQAGWWASGQTEFIRRKESYAKFKQHISLFCNNGTI